MKVWKVFSTLQDYSKNKDRIVFLDKQCFRSLQEFYPFCLSEHRNPASRVLHFTGTMLVILLLPAASLFHKPEMLLFIPLTGYGFPWVGHYFFEKNKPATFKYPLYSLLSDFILFRELLKGNEKFRN